MFRALTRAFVAFVALGAAQLMGGAAHAHPLELEGVLGAEAGAEVGYGLPAFGHDRDPFGLGVGAHAGISILSFYMGASFRYFFGGDRQRAQPGGELGYGIGWGKVLVRPYLWFGATFASSLDGGTAPPALVTVAPAVHFHVEVARPLFVGADVRYDLIGGSSQTDFATELSVMGSVGVAF